MDEATVDAGGGTAVAQANASDVDADTTQDVKNILLLDGVRLFLQLEATLLNRKDYNLFSATSGAEALEILERERIDLVLMDYVLPDMTGDEVVRAIRSNPRTRSTGVLIVTARGMREHVDRCMAAGCNDFLFKPVSRSVLCARVQDMLHVPARRHVRTLVRLQVNAQSRDRFFFGTTVNLSAGGMLIESCVDVPLGDEVEVRFFLPGGEDPVCATARVVRREAMPEGRGYAYGVSLEGMSESERCLVEDFVAAQSGQADRATATVR